MMGLLNPKSLEFRRSCFAPLIICFFVYLGHGIHWIVHRVALLVHSISKSFLASEGKIEEKKKKSPQQVRRKENAHLVHI